MLERDRQLVVVTRLLAPRRRQGGVQVARRHRPWWLLLRTVRASREPTARSVVRCGRAAPFHGGVLARLWWYDPCLEHRALRRSWCGRPGGNRSRVLVTRQGRLRA